MSERIERLREAIETMHGCKAAHVGSLPIREMFGQQVAWEGVVETFDLTGHAKAKRCHAWSYPDGKETRFVAVLELPPVVSPSTAVQAFIASQAKR
jgi:hypothetical protein